MNDETKVTIEIDGKEVKVDPSAMIIEAADQENIYIPRFCYHHKLSIAANCRMCLVDVEKAPKPLPACATPVSEGMKVSTKSENAKKAQKAVMEFLLINHPLDCPICDQGGECELQDIALGYGKDVSRFQEGKRVVTDKNLGPLIATDLTRCILCTRCVRFGAEVSGRTELGALGRGEFSKIRTFVEGQVTSEVSGNVIDLCPVGALTSKPFRFKARAWELSQKDHISPFDSWGSNLHYHVRRGQILRCVPKENESINEVWLSDRDRFGYEGFYSEDRLTTPLIKEGDSWKEISWEKALEICADKLHTVKSQSGADSIGALASPSSTTEEMYLLSKLMRTFGSNNIDHRMKQQDFSMQDKWPEYPSLGMEIEELESLDTALVVGAEINRLLPLAAIRLRKISAHDGKIYTINPSNFSSSFDIEYNLQVNKGDFLSSVIDLAGAIGSITKDNLVTSICAKKKVSADVKALAESLVSSDSKAIFVGDMILSHPKADTIISVLKAMADATGAKLSILTPETNVAGAWVSGCISHRDRYGKETNGLNALEMLEKGLSAYILLNVEPDLDIQNTCYKSALAKADFVVSLSQYKNESISHVADIILPIAVCPENEGSYINTQGDIQKFSMLVNPMGDSKPAWKVLRVLADYLQVGGFNFSCISEIQQRVYKNELSKFPQGYWEYTKDKEENSSEKDTLTVVSPSSLYSMHPTIRRSEPLQETLFAKQEAKVFFSDSVIDTTAMTEGIAVLDVNGKSVEMEFLVDKSLEPGTVLAYSGSCALAKLGKPYSQIKVKGVKAKHD